MEASPAFLEVAREEAARKGLVDRIRFEQGDFVELAERVPAADIVTLEGLGTPPCPLWSPNGRWLALGAADEVWLVDTISEEVRRLPDHDATDLVNIDDHLHVHVCPPLDHHDVDDASSARHDYVDHRAAG